MSLEDKYTKEIRPLIVKIQEFCEENHIPMVYAVQVDENVVEAAKHQRYTIDRGYYIPEKDLAVLPPKMREAMEVLVSDSAEDAPKSEMN